jgi:transmembrane protein 216
VGNKTETSLYLLYSILLAIPVGVGYMYYLILQTYVLVFDLILNAIGCLFVVLEIILSFFAIFNIKANEKTF